MKVSSQPFAAAALNGGRFRGASFMCGWMGVGAGLDEMANGDSQILSELKPELRYPHLYTRTSLSVCRLSRHKLSTVRHFTETKRHTEMKLAPCYGVWKNTTKESDVIPTMITRIAAVDMVLKWRQTEKANAFAHGCYLWNFLWNSVEQRSPILRNGALEHKTISRVEPNFLWRRQLRP